MHFSVEIIGTIGAILTTASFVPQVYKTFKSKAIDGISLSMYSVFLLGVIFWLIYGVMIRSFSIILANSVTLILIIMIITMRIAYKKRY